MNLTIIAIISSIVLSAFSTWKVQDWRYSAREAERVEAQAELARLNSKTANFASESHEEAKVQIQTKYIVVKKAVNNVVTKIEYRDRICLDNDGLRAHDSAIRLTGNTSQPENRVPASGIPE